MGCCIPRIIGTGAVMVYWLTAYAPSGSAPCRHFPFRFASAGCTNAPKSQFVSDATSSRAKGLSIDIMINRHWSQTVIGSRCHCVTVATLSNSLVLAIALKRAGPLGPSLSRDTSTVRLGAT